MTENPITPPPIQAAPASRTILKTSAHNKNENKNNGNFPPKENKAKVQDIPLDKRLKDSSAEIMTAFEEWNNQKTQKTSLEKLLETMHELRRVLSAIEISIALAEKDSQIQEPLPAPRHRSNAPRHNNNED